MELIANSEMSVFAENLRKYRDQAFPGWGGLGRFAKAAGVSPDALSRWMNGKQMPSMARLHALAKTLGVGVGELCSPQTHAAEKFAGGASISAAFRQLPETDPNWFMRERSPRRL